MSCTKSLFFGNQVQYNFIFYEIFPAVLSEMPSESWVPDPEEVGRRKDFRESHLIMSIDPKGCEDVDDAITVKKLNNGRIELGGELKIFNF